MMRTFGSHDAKMMLKKMLNHKMDESPSFCESLRHQVNEVLVNILIGAKEKVCCGKVKDLKKARSNIYVLYT